MRIVLIICWFAFNVRGTGNGADQPKTRTVDEILESYTRVLGGQATIDRVTTREVEADEHHGPKQLYYWQKPNKVLLISKGEKIGFDGSGGWILSRKKKLTRLPRGAQKPLEMNADPVRYIHLKQLYFNVQTAPNEVVDSKPMEVLVAPNDLGSTKFYFDAASHLLSRIEDTGETSAYYKHVTEFGDYKEVDGIKFPFRIVHTSTEPGMGAEDIRIKKVIQNLELKPDIFSKPNVGSVVLGGKR